jgi:hypothetical protein
MQACERERELPVDLFPVLAMHLEREDVLALSVSCVSAARGLTETRAPLVDWIVDRCVRLHGESPLTSAVELTTDDSDVSGRREGRAVVAHSALLRVLRDLRVLRVPATCVDAARALCAASARGYERAVDALLEGDTPLSALAAPRAARGAGRGEATALMGTVHFEVVAGEGCAAGPATRLEAAYRALLETPSARIAARLLDWAPEVEPEHALVVHWFFGRVHSLVHRVCETRRAGVLLEVLARRGALPGFRAAMLDRDDASRLDTPLHAALAACDRSDDAKAEPLALVRALLEAGAWHSPLDVDDKTPLHLAAVHGCAGAGCVRLLLEAGADPARRDISGRTPLHLAADRSCADACCLRELLQRACGADATAHRDSDGRTPLHLARTADAARRLIDAGADPNAASPGGESPLNCAARKARKARPDVARVLLAAGAGPNLRNTHGQTALHHARTKEVVEILVDAGARLDARDNRRRDAQSTPSSSRPWSRQEPTRSQSSASPAAPTPKPSKPHSSTKWARRRRARSRRSLTQKSNSADNGNVLSPKGVHLSNQS